MQINCPKSYTVSDRQKDGEKGVQVSRQRARARSASLELGDPRQVTSLPSGSLHISKPRILAIVSQGDSEDRQKTRWAVTRSPAPLPSPGTSAMEPAGDQPGNSRVDWGLAQQKSTSQTALGALRNATGTK